MSKKYYCNQCKKEVEIIGEKAGQRGCVVRVLSCGHKITTANMEKFLAQAPALYRALFRSIAQEGKNELERFLVQQNVIQYLLTSLVQMRSGLINNEFINWIENAPLGTIINTYKICVRRNEVEKKLIEQLENYNKKRRNLVHKLMNPKYQNELAKTNSPHFGAVDTNALGIKIINSLEQLVTEEIEKIRKH